MENRLTKKKSFVLCRYSVVNSVVQPPPKAVISPTKSLKFSIRLGSNLTINRHPPNCSRSYWTISMWLAGCTPTKSSSWTPFSRPNFLLDATAKKRSVSNSTVSALHRGATATPAAPVTNAATTRTQRPSEQRVSVKSLRGIQGPSRFEPAKKTRISLGAATAKRVVARRNTVIVTIWA